MSAKEKPRLRKIYLLPNLFTTGNMFCGFYAIVSAMHNNFVTAAWSVMAGIIFDSMDGRVARLTRATSAFGVEYDSLSDLITFGMAPALVAYQWCLEPFGRLGWLAAFLYVVCAALRLARFNVLVNAVPKKYFQGMPSPLAAATIATSVIFYNELSSKIEPLISKDMYMLVLVLVLGSLMISTVRFPSFKEFKVDRENSFPVLAVLILTVVLVAVRPEVSLFGLCIIYTSISLLVEAYRVIFRRGSGADEVIEKEVKNHGSA
jgi:CDP-diacylglycerol--serine O-phosphatidyltransferase